MSTVTVPDSAQALYHPAKTTKDETQENGGLMTQFTTRDGTPISQLTFGTMQFGGTADASESAAMYAACRHAGINHFDTAHLYTGGASETILGNLIKPEREAIFLATKVGYSGSASAQDILTQVEGSLGHLKDDSIDLLYMHRFDDHTPLEETFQTLATLQADGIIRYIGVSNYAAWQVMKAQSIAKSFGTQIDAMQPMYNLVKRQAEVELFPMAADQGMTIFPYSPLGGGLLTGKYVSGGSGRLVDDARYQARYGQDWMHQTAAAFAALAQERGIAPATLAVAWAAKHSARPHPIVSARSVAQLMPSLAATEFEMDETLYREITDLSITPPPATDRIEEA